MIINLKKHPWV